MSNYHLVILKKPYLDAILRGEKKVESRLIKAKLPPFGQIFVGDILFLKQSSGAVCATAAVKSVRQFENLNPERILKLKQKYNNLILGGDEYWENKKDSQFAVLVWLGDIKVITPIQINKKDWRAWVVLTKNQDFGLLKRGF
jgi:ASC-1-like (ASCH) protein